MQCFYSKLINQIGGKDWEGCSLNVYVICIVISVIILPFLKQMLFQWVILWKFEFIFLH